jgi:hypothetical protein
MSSIETTDKLSLLFINRKDKTYIRSTVTKVNGDVLYHIYKSNDGIHDELTSEGIFAADMMPKPVSEIYSASVNLANYIKKNGYRVCNTIVQTKNGVKFK